MDIAVILNAHGNTPIVSDTVDALHTWVSKEVLMVVDGLAWDSWGKDVKLPVWKLKGFEHGYPKAPYRNLIFGLKEAVKQWPDRDWYAYCEYDVLFTSEAYKEVLAKVEDDVWCVGTDMRISTFQFPYLERMVDLKLEQSGYFLGCCVFYSKAFVKKLLEIDFFEKFLTMTNGFEKGYFPGYDEQGGYDFGEHLLPTLALGLGGKLHQFSKWNPVLGLWTGDRRFQLRWKPEVQMDECLHHEASIVHPVKGESEIRWLHRSIRNRKKKCLSPNPSLSSST